MSKLKLSDIFSTWELKLDQACKDDVLSPGARGEFIRLFYSLVASSFRVLASDMDKWTARCDDAQRIPDIIREKANMIDGAK